MALKVSQVMKLLLRDKFKNNSGLTLVELLLSTLLITVIVGLVTMSYFNSTKATETTITVATSVKDARTAMYRVTRDIREIRKALGIEEADTDEVTFYSNVDSDDEFEKVHYYLEDDGGFFNLLRQIDDGDSKVVVTHLISDGIFSYKTAFGEDSLSTPVSTSELENIRSIGINLIIDQESTTEGNRTMNLETSVTLRNRV